MIRKKLLIQPIQRACVIPLVFVSLMSYSQLVQAQLSNSDFLRFVEKPTRNLTPQPPSIPANGKNSKPLRHVQQEWLAAQPSVSSLQERDFPDPAKNQLPDSIQNTVKNSQFQSFQQPKLPKNGAPTGRRRAGAGRNPECPSSLTHLTALVPGDGGKSFLASTVAEYPTFWFYVPELPETARSAEFVLNVQDSQDVQNVYRTPLTLSGKPGIISITPPPQRQYSLKADQRYHWYFHIYCGDPEKTSDNFYVDGFVQRQVLTEALDSQLKTAKPKEYIAYSANNIWYDALTNLGQLHRTNLQNATLNKDWVDLLNAIGLQDFAKEPIVQDYNLEK
ncbi:MULTISPECIES: DUF928 domain-containing protein [unclassified Nostoc]|uniref:DUF928 domain-containing protein n=1 Tax=unclassified Nostoc TaxID=2593658 RepID=UPI00261EC11F|nr:DUF928 domain-containing protein [Nostoc sp. S13]MDF5738478.1 DUF928 domain-containing protein [Nostoc sp. S13]